VDASLYLGRKKGEIPVGKIKMKEQAPDFSLMDTNGEKFRLSEWKGKKWIYLVLNRGFA
jgi:cytochrome oxidase Cu insertion factor (SCO1/SenC/PrrC family)